MATAAASPTPGPTIPVAREVDLYAPVKALLEVQGYEVKGEIHGCDVVGIRGEEPPVIVELKRAFGLELVHQGIDRLAISDAVYLAVATWPRRVDDVRRLLRRLGLGLIVVDGTRADVVLDPAPYVPRRNSRRAARLLGEHRRRVGDPTRGGSTRTPIMTAYRQEAIRCLGALADGPRTLRAIRLATDAPHAAGILQRDVYGWFERVDRGTYALTPRGREALDAATAPPASPPGSTP
jgi:hypothetical protein